jgi:hypothetical protein
MIIKHLSPSSRKKWLSNREEWFLHYGCAAPRVPPTRPMIVGSAFDAHAKRGIWRCLGRTDLGDEVFDACIKGIEASQLDWALKAGDELWQMYKRTGFPRLLTVLQAAVSLEMETDLTIEHEGVRIYGKPDLFWKTTHESGIMTRDILDWKVNGYERKQSPRAGYAWFSGTGDAYRGSGRVTPLGDQDWLDQTCTYGWMDGVCVGDIGAHIHQILPPDRVAFHEYVIPLSYQREVWESYKNMWDCIKRDRIFTDLSEEEDTLRQEQLRARSYSDPVFAAMCR